MSNIDADVLGQLCVDIDSAMYDYDPYEYADYYSPEKGSGVEELSTGLEDETYRSGVIDKLTDMLNDATTEEYNLYKSLIDRVKALDGSLEESFDDEYNWYDSDSDSQWEMVETKSVPDSDGFYTDYTMYKNVDDNASPLYVFIFGDNELYNPANSEYDWECDTLEDAYDWFDFYNGLVEESLTESNDTPGESRLDVVVMKKIPEGYKCACGCGTDITGRCICVEDKFDDSLDSMRMFIPEHWDFVSDMSLQDIFKQYKPSSLKESYYDNYVADGGTPVFMLMYYSSTPGTGMEGDSFDCAFKFFGNDTDTVKSLNKKLEELKVNGLVPEDTNNKGYTSNYYVAEYNEHFDDESEVYQNLETGIENYFTDSYDDDIDIPFN